MRLLLLGAGGRLGAALAAELAPGHDLLACPREKLDITDAAAMKDAIGRFAPDVIVNAAAYTDVAGAEKDEAAARTLNADAVGQLGRLAAGATVVHISTDFVFDGALTRPYVETDQTGPLSVYGATKLAGERALIESRATCAILRTAWLFGPTPPSFVATMIEGAKAGRHLRVVNDQFGSPTSNQVLAMAVRTLLEASSKTLANALAENPVFHLACRGEASWFDLAQAAIAEAGMDPGAVEPISTPQGTPGVRRPAYSMLDSSRFEQTFGIRLPHWRAALRPAARSLS